VNKQALRNVLRWGGLALALIGFILGRVATNANMFNAGRVLVWVGLVMIVGGIIVRLFISEP
jgi:VIT1/CCC1 family predicted Fe2+/Mn2+ transporter